MSKIAAWLAVLGTIVLTSYGQIIIKQRVVQAGSFDGAVGEKFFFLLRVAFDPWVLSGIFAAFVAGFLWIAAMTRLPLNLAYPFMSLTFVLVLLMSGIWLGEQVSMQRWIGTGIIMLGLIVANSA